MDIKLLPDSDLSGNVVNHAVSLEITFSKFRQIGEFHYIYNLLLVLFRISNIRSENQMIQSSDWGENIVSERSI